MYYPLISTIIRQKHIYTLISIEQTSEHEKNNENTQKTGVIHRAKLSTKNVDNLSTLSTPAHLHAPLIHIPCG